MAIISVPLSSANIKDLQRTDDFMYRRMKACSGRGSACQFIMGVHVPSNDRGQTQGHNRRSPHQSLQLIIRHITGLVRQMAHQNHQRIPCAKCKNIQTPYSLHQRIPIHLFKLLVLDMLQNNAMIAAVHKHTITLAQH